MNYPGTIRRYSVMLLYAVIGAMMEPSYYPGTIRRYSVMLLYAIIGAMIEPSYYPGTIRRYSVMLLYAVIGAMIEPSYYPGTIRRYSVMLLYAVIGAMIEPSYYPGTIRRYSVMLLYAVIGAMIEPSYVRTSYISWMPCEIGAALCNLETASILAALEVPPTGTIYWFRAPYPVCVDLGQTSSVQQYWSLLRALTYYHAVQYR
ncbi:hypothetical protein J6590_082013 [Homalodisca vitripennis]|nr:hypothetical protein J6590_082013 [Homalodisca vitripennis]